MERFFFDCLDKNCNQFLWKHRKRMGRLIAVDLREKVVRIVKLFTIDWKCTSNDKETKRNKAKKRRNQTKRKEERKLRKKMKEVLEINTPWVLFCKRFRRIPRWSWWAMTVPSLSWGPSAPVRVRWPCGGRTPPPCGAAGRPVGTTTRGGSPRSAPQTRRRTSWGWWVDGWLINWWVDDWLIDWSIDWLIDWLIDGWVGGWMD